jgi:hypothetical protein
LKPYSIGLQAVFARKIDSPVAGSISVEGYKLLALDKVFVDNICDNSWVPNPDTSGLEPPEPFIGRLIE